MTSITQRRLLDRFGKYCAIAALLGLVWLPVSAQIEDQAGWDAAYYDKFGGVDPFHDGPWLDFGPSDPSGTFGQKFAWNAHFILRAYLSMAETFGDARYLDRTVTLIEEMLRQRDDRRVARGELDVLAEPYTRAPSFYLQQENRHLGAKGWRAPFRDEIRIEALTDGQICDAIMRFVDLVQEDSRFEAYRDSVPRYIADVAETVAMHDSSFVFDRFPGVPGIYYYPNQNGSGLHGGSLPLNHNFVILRVALLLDKHRNNAIHQPKVTAFLQYFWSVARLNVDKYEWDYDPRGASTAPEDFGHGAIDIASLILAHDRGLVDSLRMERLTRTYTDNLYRGDGDTARHVDGTGDEFDSHHAAIGWINLVRFDPEVFDIAVDVLTEDDPTPNWSKPLLGWAEILRLQHNDPDRDGVLEDDNCPTVANTDQADRDGDEAGDGCDPCPDDPTLSRPSFEFLFGASIAWMIRPYDLAIAPSGRIWVTDVERNQLGRFTSAGGFSGTVGRTGSANGQFDRPSGIAIDAAGMLYVADSGNHRVQKFGPFGEFRSTFGSEGTNPGQFMEPVGIAIDPAGRIVVSDAQRSRILLFDLAGNFLFEFGETGSDPGQLSGPYGVDAGPGGRIYVADSLNARLQVFDANGTFLFAAGSPGSGLGEFGRPRHVAVDPDGRAFVADDLNGRIQVFSADGAPTLAFGTAGVFAPHGVAIGADRNVYVTETVDGAFLALSPLVPNDDRDAWADCVDPCPDIADHDGDGYSVDAGCPDGLEADCDDGNPDCTADCTDVDADGICVETDCDDGDAACSRDCTDGDGDAVCLDADCADLDAGAWAIPPVVRDLRFVSPGTLEWRSLSAEAGDGTTYRVTRGVFPDLAAGPTETFDAPADLAPRLQDLDIPPVNAVFYYFVQGTNACGESPPQN